MKNIPCIMPIALLLTGCVSLSDSQVSRFDAMSCPELAIALEYEEQGERRSGGRALLNGLTELTSKGEARSNAGLASLDHQLEEDEHRLAKKYILDRQDDLDC